jgi:hypothetical protein
MMPEPKGNESRERAYLEQVEDVFRHIRGKPIVLSPVEFECVIGWCRRQVPLHLVLRVIESLGGRALRTRSGSQPRSILYFQEAVEDEFKRYTRGRAGVRSAGRDLPSISKTLNEVAGRVSRSRAPEELKRTVIAALEALTDEAQRTSGDRAALPELDRLLMTGCESSLSDHERRDLEQQVDSELAPHRMFLDPAAQQRAASLVRARLIRQRFLVPDLSLLPPWGGHLPG